MRDVGLNEIGDLPASTYFITGDELILQRISIRLRTWMGEWILDRFQGLQYERLFMQKPPHLTEFSALVRLEIEAVPGIAQARITTATVDQETREIRMEGRVQIADEERAIALALSTEVFSVEFVTV